MQVCLIVKGRYQLEVRLVSYSNRIGRCVECCPSLGGTSGCWWWLDRFSIIAGSSAVHWGNRWWYGVIEIVAVLLLNHNLRVGVESSISRLQAPFVTMELTTRVLVLLEHGVMWTLMTVWERCAVEMGTVLMTSTHSPVSAMMVSLGSSVKLTLMSVKELHVVDMAS